MTQPAPAASPPEPTQLMYDAATGQPVDVPLSQVGDAVRSGAAGFAEGQKVIVRDHLGELREVSPDEAVAHFEGTYLGGAGTRDAYEQQEYDRSLDTVGGMVGAFAVGAGNALTLGFGKGIMATAGRSAEENARIRRYLEAQERVNPGSGMAGEVAGAIAPALLSGGGSLAARGGGGLLARAGALAGAPAEGLGFGAGLLGKGASRLVAGAMGEGIASRTAGVLVRGAAEGAVYGIGAEVSRALVHNDDLTADKIIAAAGHGALIGGALGGGVHGIGEAIGAGGRAVGRLLNREAAAADRIAAEVSPMVREGSIIDQVAAKAGVTPERVAAFAEEKAIKSLTGGHGGQRMIAEVEAMAPEARARVAKLVLETVPERTGKLINSREVMHEVVEAERRAAGERIGALVRELDASGAKVDRGAVVDRLAEIEARAAQDITIGERAARDVADVRSRLADLKTYPEVTFEQLHQMRASIDKTINKLKRGGDAQRLELVRDMRRVVEEELQAQASRAAPPGAEWAARWQAAKGDYQAAAWASRASEKAAIADKANRTLGMSEQLGAIGGSNVGAQIGGAVAGPIGAFVGGTAGGLLSAYGNNLVRRFGDQAVATVASRVAKEGTAGALVGAVNEIVRQGAAKIVGAGTRTAKAIEPVVGALSLSGVGAGVKRAVLQQVEERHAADTKQARAAEFARRTEAVRRYVASGGAASRAYTSTLPEGLAERVQGRAMSAAQWLASKIPQPVGANPLTQQGGVVPASEQAKFLRYARAVDNPLSVLEDAARGRLTPEAAEAIRAVYPALAGEIAGQVLAAVSVHGKPPPYSTAVQIGTLLGQPTHALLEPATLGALQRSFAAGGGEPPGPDGGAVPSSQQTLRPVNIAEGATTKSQRIAG